MYGVGVDLGTSFSAAAVARGGALNVAVLGDAADGAAPATAIPSAAFLDADGTLLTGEAADRRGMTEPDRMAREFKRRLGDPTPLVLAGAPHSPATLMAAALRDILATIRHTQGDQPPDRIVLTCPAVWGPYRREQFAAVPQLADLPNPIGPDSGTDPADTAGPIVRVVTEPVAAATYYCSTQPLPPDGLLAVYDLGGGTFDCAIVRNGAHEMEIVGVPEGVEWLGGADFDQAVLDHVDRKLDGALTALDPADPGTATTLAAVRRQCTLAKETLSDQWHATISVPLGGDTRPVEITRQDFERMIGPAVDTTVEAFRRTLTAAGVTLRDLTAVLLVGGSSQIPLVIRVLGDVLRRPVLLSPHPKHAVAFGAALLAAGPAAVSAAAVSAATSGPPANQASSPPGGPGGPDGPGEPDGPDGPGGPGAAAGPDQSPPDQSAPDQQAPDQQAPDQPTPNQSTPTAGRPASTRSTLKIGLGRRARAAAWARRRSRLVAAAAAAAMVVVLATVTAAVLISSGGDEDTTGASSRPTLENVVIYDTEQNGPYTLYVASADNDWAALPANYDATTAGKSLTVLTNDKGSDGDSRMRATWSGGGPAQFYLQTLQTADMSAYADADAAVVFDATVHTPPAARTTIDVHCVYPCVGQVNATTLFRSLPVEQQTTVTIPLACFIDKGLDITIVNTYFLVATSGTLDVSFSRIRWVPGAAAGPDSRTCNSLT